MDYTSAVPLNGVVAAALRAKNENIFPGFVNQVHAKYPPRLGFVTVLNDGVGSPTTWVAAKDIILESSRGEPRDDWPQCSVKTSGGMVAKPCSFYADISRNTVKYKDDYTHVHVYMDVLAALGKLSCGTVDEEVGMIDYCQAFLGDGRITAHAKLAADLTLKEDGSVDPHWKQVALELSNSPTTTKVIIQKNQIAATLPLSRALFFFSAEARYEYVKVAAKQKPSDGTKMMKALNAWESAHEGKYTFATEKMHYAFKQLGITMDDESSLSRMASMSISRPRQQNENFRISASAVVRVTVWDFRQKSGSSIDDWKVSLISSSNTNGEVDECRREGHPPLRCFQIKFRIESNFEMDRTGNTIGYQGEIKDVEVSTGSSIARGSAESRVREEVGTAIDDTFLHMFQDLAQLTLAHHKDFRGDQIKLNFQVESSMEDIVMKLQVVHDEDVMLYAAEKIRPVVQLLSSNLPPGPWTLKAPMIASLTNDMRLQFEAHVGTLWKHDMIVNLSEIVSLLDIVRSMMMGA